MEHLRILILLMALLPSGNLYAQLIGQPKIDSMLAKLPKAKEDTNKVLLLDDLTYEYYRFNMADTAITYGNVELELATKLNWDFGIASANNVLGMSHLGKRDQKNALVYFERALNIYEHMGRKDKAGTVAFNMGNVYVSITDNRQASNYFYKALKIFDATDRCDMVASCYTGIGSVYTSMKDYEKALESHEKALKIMETCPKVDSIDKLNAYHNLGLCYQYKGDCENSLIYDFKTLRLSRELGLPVITANMSGNICLTYTKLRDYENAMLYGKRSLAIADSIHHRGLAAWALYELGHAYLSSVTDTVNGVEMQQISMGETGRESKAARTHIAMAYLERSLDSISFRPDETELHIKIYEDLSGAYKLTGNWEKALQAHEKYIAIKDSVFSKETDKQLLAQQMNYDFDRKEAATRVQQEKKDARQRNIRNYTLAGMAGLLAFSIVVIRQRNRVRKEKANVEAEKGKSEALLLNILPYEVAEELKTQGTTAAKHYDNVTVLFTDFINFTKASEDMSPQNLIDELHACFKAFDEITSRYNIEKIKTIGDAYLAVCGLPTTDPKHAENIVRAAKEISDFMTSRLAHLGIERTFRIRIGIHSGSVVAGIVGVKKFAYDIWGDTVNTAARMEQHGEAGKINISQTTYELVKDKFTCEYRGEVEAKGKGVMKMYFVS